MIDPEPVEIPDTAEPTHVAVAEPVEIVEVIGDQDVILEVTADLAEDGNDDLEYMAGYLLLYRRTPEEFQNNLIALARKLDPVFDAYLAEAEGLVDAAVWTLHLEIEDPDQFGA